jgi:acetolactate synthase I/II/III large subunit
MEKKTPWKAVVEALKAEGVEYLFGLPGNPLFLYDDLYDNPDISPILARNEVSGAFMAIAYGRLKGQPGVCFASPGPGMANLVSGLLEAQAGCFPLVAITAAPSREFEGMGVFQETNSLELVRPVTKWAVRVDIPERVGWTIARAFSLATTGKPGPVYVEIPADVAATKVDMPEYRPLARSIRCGADPALVDQAATLLKESKRPVIWAGGGVILSRAGAELQTLASALQAPVVTTPQGRGVISEDHPLAFGLVGLYRTESTAMAFDDADLLLVVGSQCEEFQSGLWKQFPKGARLIQMDIDASQLGRNWVPDIGMVADARIGLGQLTRSIEGEDSAKAARRSRVADLQLAKEAYIKQIAAECDTMEKPIRAKRVVHAINRVFGSSTILVNENGGMDLWSYYYPYFKVLEEGGCLAPAEQTCMGIGVTGVIGAKLARPDLYAVCVTGDGAFQMFLGELGTAVQYNAAATWVVLNNHSLGWIKYIQQTNGERYISTDFTAQPDFVHVAASAGCHAARVTEPEQVDSALEQARLANDAGQPAVLDIAVEAWDGYSSGFYDFHKNVWGMEGVDF